MTAKQLRKWREDRNLTREQVAKLLSPGKEKLSLRTVERWEQGRGKIPVFLPLALEAIDLRNQLKDSTK